MTLLSLTLLLASPLPASLAPQEFSAGRVPEIAGGFETIFELSDWDQNGEVTLAEVGQFEDWIGLGLVGDPYVVTVAAEIFLQGINRDDLKAWTDKDLADSLAALDADGNGSIEKSEVTLRALCNGQMGTRGVINRIAHELLIEEADEDGDGSVSAAEIAGVKGRWTGRALNDLAADWVAKAKKREPADRNRMSPGVAFFTLEAELDQNRDEILDQDRLREAFRQLDADGNGVLTREERRVRLSRPAGDSWRRPSEERLKLPCLMPWQRSLEDALAVQQRTGQPLLLCVNMDGETACDSLASWRYRDPEFAKMAAGYVCVVVSPDDHQPRDYDDRGRRLESPRLGRVTDTEHIELEPVLFERYFNGRRVAPRHVGVAPDGEILFDAYLLTDPSVLDAQLREHSTPVAEPLDWQGMATADLSGYPDAEAREEMERRMLSDDVAVRLEAAGFAGVMPDAGMIGLRDPEASVRTAAALAMAQMAGSLGEVHRARLLETTADLDAGTRSEVVQAMTPAVEGDPYAMASLASLDPASRVSSLGQVDDWRAAARLSTLAPNFARRRDAALALLEQLDARVDPASAQPAHALIRAHALLDLAHAFLNRAEDPRDAAAEAITFARQGAPASPARAQAIIASASVLAGDFASAVRSSRAALTDLWAASSDPLSLYALQALRTGATQLIYAELKAGQPVAESLVADAMLAGRALVAHSAATEADATQLLDLAGAVRDVAGMDALLMECVTRFPASADLHQRFRNHVLRSRGAASMAAGYDAVDRAVTEAGYSATLQWFRGLAMLVAAEWDVQQGMGERAISGYVESARAFEASVNEEPAFADSANHYRVLGSAGAATLVADKGEFDKAVRLIQSIAELRPASLDLKDGLGRTPRERSLAIRAEMEAASVEAPAPLLPGSR